MTMYVHFQFNHNHCFSETAFIHFPTGFYVKNYCGGHLGFLVAT
jgi:hypothetical protein